MRRLVNEMPSYGEITEFLIQTGIVKLTLKHGVYLPADSGLMITVMRWSEENTYIPFIDEHGWHIVLYNSDQIMEMLGNARNTSN